jgi:hypothetical protein
VGGRDADRNLRRGAARAQFEEHGCLFGPAMSRLFGIAFPDERFLQIFSSRCRRSIT